MTVYEIGKSKKRMAIFDRVLEEACRQWCDFMEEAPQRKTGEGFASFFYEVFQDKEQEYWAEYCAAHPRDSGSKSRETER